MKKHIIIIVLSVISVCASGQALSDDTLHWTEHRKLSWNDFKGDTIDIPGLSGQTIMLVLADFNKYHAFLPTSTSVTTIFDRKNSWTANQTKSGLYLKYYQTEFNLYEVCARQLRKEFSKTKFGMNPTIIFQQKYNSMLTELSNRSKLHMKETKLGTDSIGIEKWHSLMITELIELEQFKKKK